MKYSVYNCAQVYLKEGIRPKEKAKENNKGAGIMLCSVSFKKVFRKAEYIALMACSLPHNTVQIHSVFRDILVCITNEISYSLIVHGEC